MNKFGRFQGKSNRESKNMIREDRGLVSRCLTWFAELGGVLGLSRLSNTMAKGAWGKTLVVASNVGLVFLASDALLSVEEIATNAHIFKSKKRAVKKYLKFIKKSDVDIFSTEHKKEEEIVSVLGNDALLKSNKFRNKHADILKQVFVDFDDDKKFDIIRKVLSDKGLIDSEIELIKLEVLQNGKISSNLLNSIAPKNGDISKVLDIIACDDFADRIVDNYNCLVGRYNSKSHLKGALTLTNTQQGRKKFALTKEQEYVYVNTSSKSALVRLFLRQKHYFKEKLKSINSLILNGNYDKAEVLQERFLKNMRTQGEGFDNMDKLAAKGKGLRKAIKIGANQTNEKSIAKWTRHVFPLTKKAGKLARVAINYFQAKTRYRGEFKAHRYRKIKLENQTKLKFSDVYCENGTGFRNIRKQYKAAGYQDFVHSFNKASDENDKIPNSFVCGYVKDLSKFNILVSTIISEIKNIEKQAKIFVRNGTRFAATCYLDEPVVIKINGHNIGEGKNQLPLATINVDHNDILKSVIIGLVKDIANNNIDVHDINNIQFISEKRKTGFSGSFNKWLVAKNRERTIYVPQIIDAVKRFENGESIEATSLFRTVKSISQNETFFRVFEDAKEFEDEALLISEPLRLASEASNETVLKLPMSSTEASLQSSTNADINNPNTIVLPEPVIEQVAMQTNNQTSTTNEQANQQTNNNQTTTEGFVPEELENSNPVIIDLEKMLDKLKKLKIAKLVETKSTVELKGKAQIERTSKVHEVKVFQKLLNQTCKKINDIIDNVDEKIKVIEKVVDEIKKDNNNNPEHLKKQRKIIKKAAEICKETGALIRKKYKEKVFPIVKDPFNPIYTSKKKNNVSI